MPASRRRRHGSRAGRAFRADARSRKDSGAHLEAFDKLIAAGSYATAREKGLLRLEGKDYIMQEGDVVHFRFNV